ncbi:MAG: RNA polymerase sigma-70 factor ECF [Planctomycetota bacterium]|nr:MAG: RNA polymerase sigma-70 factor ECF [Planctomycetota bacterium]
MTQTEPSIGGETIPIEWSAEADADLMRRLAGGEVRALDVLVKRWSARLSSYFYRLTGDSGEVDDLVQETFIRVHGARDGWAGGGNFSAWIHTIARRLAMDRARTMRRKPVMRASDRAVPAGQTTTLFGRIPDNAPTPYACASRLELLAIMEEALRAIPEIYREAVVLCDLQQLSYEEAGEVLRVPAKTVSSRLARGREALRQAMAAYRSGVL